MPFFSIIIPIYNVEKYLNKCVDSVVNQTFDDIEVILVDDGSTDNSPAICDSYAEKDKRVKVIHKPNGGLSDARNTGIKNSAGKYLISLDSDDYWNDRSALLQLSKKADSGYDIIMFGCTDWNIHTGEKKISKDGYNIELLENSGKQEILHYLFSQKMIPGGANIFAVSSKIIKDNSIKYKKGICSEDYDFIMSTVFCCNSFSAINNPFYIYRKGRKDSITSSSFSKIIAGVTYTIDKWYKASSKIEDEQVKADLLNYLAFIYSTSLVSLGMADQSQINEAIKTLNEHKFILKYAYWNNVKLVRLFVSVFGIKSTAKMLKTYFKLK